MNRFSLGFLCVAGILLLSSCRMADGPMPDPKAESEANRVGDLARDLGNVLAGHEEARTDFVEDLLVFVDLGDKPEAEKPVRDLAAQIMTAVEATKAAEPAMVPLLEQVVIGLEGIELSENQVKAVQESVQQEAARLGVDDVKARALGAQVGIVQQAVAERHRRWYELF